MNQAVCIGSSEFTGKALRQATVAKAAQSVSFTVRAAGYEEELIKTAVRPRSSYLVSFRELA